MITRTLAIIIKLAIASFVLLIARRGKDNQVVALIWEPGFQKLLEIQNRMETEIQKLVTEYQRQQLISIVLSPFIKLFNFIQSYVVVK